MVISGKALTLPRFGRSLLAAGVQLGVPDRLDDAIRGNNVTLYDGGGEAFDDGRRRRSVQERAIDEATTPFHAQALRFVIGADDDRWEGQADFLRREVTLVQARAFRGDQQGADNVGGIGVR